MAYSIRTKLSLMTTAQLLGSLLLLLPSASVPAAEPVRDAVQAYRLDALVRKEIDTLQKLGLAEAALRTTLMRAECNPLSCLSRTLVAHTFATQGANARTRTILAEVNFLELKVEGEESRNFVEVRRVRPVRVSNDGVAFEASSGSILDAYRSHEEIAAELDRLRTAGYGEGILETYPISRECGSEGCSSSSLVVHEFRPVAPTGESFAVLALVAVDPLGRIVDVDRVELLGESAGHGGAQLLGSSLASAGAAEVVSTPELQAYLSSASARAAIEALLALGYSEDALRAVPVMQQVAPGLYTSRTLIVHTFETGDANTQTRAILAAVDRVETSFLGETETSIRVELVRTETISGIDVAFDENSSSVLDAYRSHEEIAAELERLRSSGFGDGVLRMYPISRDCGTAGCSSSTLVAHEFWPFLLPRRTDGSFSILAVVSVDPLGKIVDVDRVRLVVGAATQ